MWSDGGFLEYFLKLHFPCPRCENVGKPKVGGCGKKVKGKDKKTYYGEKKKKVGPTSETANKEEKNKQTDNMTKQKRQQTVVGNKSMRHGGRIENVLEKPRWVLV